jgi:dihydropteroate synthase
VPVLLRPLVMGVVNVTPDSFSDGGRYDTTDAAIAHALALREEGADLLDIGGESTRPGATRPLVAEELDRVVPVIRALAGEDVAVSVDTMRHEVAEAALEAGAVLVNDVSGGLADPQVLDVVAEHGAAYVAMHWRAHSAVMQQLASYDRAQLAAAATVAGARSARGADPGRVQPQVVPRLPARSSRRHSATGARS